MLKFLFTLLIILFIDLIDSSSIVKRTAIGRRWPNNQIPYLLSDSFGPSDKDFIEKTLKIFESSLSVDGKKCLEFIPRTTQKSYIQIVDTDRCSSVVGFTDGINRLNLAKSSCIKQGIILHEFMHAIGFDHEQSRHDRDEHINVHIDNINDNLKSNFDINEFSNSKTAQDSPYDYHSILQYNSHTMSKNKEFSITSKVPSLLKSDKIELKFEDLSPIDIIEIQRFYRCKETKIQEIKNINSTEIDSLSNFYEQFHNEVSRLSLNTNIASDYFRRSIQTCGLNHYWPLDYPIVDKHHELYKTVCLKKKQKNTACKFSIECDNNMECAKVLLRNGVCRQPNTNSFKLFARILQSKVEQLSGDLKKQLDNELLVLKRIIKTK